jgi:serine/threonine protein kinase
VSLIKRGYELNNHIIGDVIGEGAMGTVFVARHKTLKKTIAVKVIKSSLARDPEVVARFRREALAVGRLKHENIVEVTDVGVVPETIGSPAPENYFLMEHLTGGDTLDNWLVSRGKQVSLPQTLEIADQLCKALVAAHAAGVVHRDLKPSNIYIVDRDGRLHIKVFDFGLVKLATVPDVKAKPRRDPNHDMQLTMGNFLGSPLYVSPEQATGEESTTFPTDIYSVGAILYELVTGTPSITFPESRARTFEEKVNLVRPIIVSQKPVPVRELVPSCPTWLASLIEECLAKKAEQRPVSMEVVRARIAAGRAEMTKRTNASDDQATMIVDLVELRPKPRQPPVVPPPAPAVAPPPQQFARASATRADRARDEIDDAEPTLKRFDLENDATDPKARRDTDPTLKKLDLESTYIERRNDRGEPGDPRRTVPLRLVLIGAGIIAVLLCIVVGLVVYIVMKAPGPVAGVRDASVVTHDAVPTPSPDAAAVAQPCPPGMEVVAGGQKHYASPCCWPGQRHGDTGCTGRPTSCPESMVATWDDCTKDPEAIHKSQFVGTWIWIRPDTDPVEQYSFTIKIKGNAFEVIGKTPNGELAAVNPRWVSDRIHMSWAGTEMTLSLSDGSLVQKHDDIELKYAREP